LLSFVSLGIIIQIVSFILAFARIKILSDSFSVADYGLISIYFSVISFISILVIFNTDRFIFRTAAENGKYARVATKKLFVLPFFFGPLSIIYFYIDPKFSYFAYIAMANVTIIGAFHLLRFYFLGIGMTKTYLVSSFLMTNLWFLILLFILYFRDKMSVINTFEIMLLSHVFLLIIGAIAFIKTPKLPHPDLPRIELSAAIKYSAGFLPIIISSRILELGDKYIVNSLMSSREMGLLIMGNSVLACVIALLSVLSDIFRPYMNSFADDLSIHQINKYFFSLGLIGVYVACLIFFSYGDIIFKNVISDAYFESCMIAKKLLPGTLISFLILYFINILERERNSRRIAIAYTIGSLIYLPITFVLVYLMGINGAIMASYISNAAIVLLLGMYHWKYFFELIRPLIALTMTGLFSIVLVINMDEFSRGLLVALGTLLASFLAFNLLHKTSRIISALKGGVNGFNN